MNCKTQASHHRKRCLHVMSPCRDNIRENFVTNKEKKGNVLPIFILILKLILLVFRSNVPESDILMLKN